MKIVQLSASETLLEQHDWRDFLEVYIDGELVFSVEDDEPEDNNLGRSFGDCFKVAELIYNAASASPDSVEMFRTVANSWEEKKDMVEKIKRGEL